MFIRCTPTRNRHFGQPYLTYRLVHGTLVGSSVKQSTRLNLGGDFDLPQDQWAALAARIDQLVRGQGSLVESSLCDAGQALAQRYAAQRGRGRGREARGTVLSQQARLARSADVA